MNNYMEITYVASWCIIVLMAIILIASVYVAIKEYLDKQDDQEASEEEEDADGSREYWRDRTLMFKDWYYEALEKFNDVVPKFNDLEKENFRLEGENADLRYQLRQYEEAKERKNVTAATNSGNEQPREEFIDRRNADV